MTAQSVLITGAGGQVGRALSRLLPQADARVRDELDVTDADAVLAAVAGAEVIFHLAAMTHVDAAEMAPSRAEEVNDRGTAHVVAAARHHSARVIYISTDYVFRGDAAPYAEDDSPDPVNVYGRTKLGGEGHLDPDHDLIVRTSWVYGDGRNFIASILQAARQGPVSVVADQFGRPTSAADLANALVHLCDAATTGKIHVAGDGPPCSWADLAETALRAANSDATVNRIGSDEYAGGSSTAVAPRPRDATLSLERARQLGVPLVDWRRAVAAYVGEIA